MAVQLQMKLLGGFELRLASGADLEIPTRKAQCLLAYLALHPGEAQSREKLMGLFWAESDEKHAQGSLRQTLTYLRQSLNGVEPLPLVTARGRVSLEPGAIEVDALRFSALTSSRSPEDLEVAAGLYKGDLLEGEGVKVAEFEAWLEDERRRLRERYGQVLLNLATAKSEAGDCEEAIRIAQRLLALDPLQERVHRLLMELYSAAGLRESALQQFQSCQALLAEELGVEPEEATSTLYEALRGTAQMPIADPGKAVSPKPTPETGVRLEKPLFSTVAGRGLRHQLVAGTLIAVLIVAGALVWLQTRTTRDEPASLARTARSLPEIPSIAVLPFENIGGDPAQDYFSDGITDDLITDLSQIPGLFVIARNSTFVYKNKATPIRQVAEELGVVYVLEGSVRREGEQIRINAQLINTTTGGHLWAERYDGSMSDVLALQDEVTAKVARGLEVRFAESEAAKGARRETDRVEAYDAVLRAMEHIRRFSREDMAIAIRYLEKAIHLDPAYARAHTILGGVFWDVANEDWARSLGLSLTAALERSRYHLGLGAAVPSPVLHFYLSKAHSNEGRYDEAIVEANKMIVLDPNNIHGYRALARAFNKAGLAEEGMTAIQTAIRHDPWGDRKGWMSYRLGESLYLLGRYKEAVEVFTASVEKSQSEWSHLFIAAAHGQLGQLDLAREALATFDGIREAAGRDPYSIAHVENWAFKHHADRERIQEGLRKAGLSEGAPSIPVADLAQDVSPQEVAGATTIDGAMAKELFERGVVMVDVRDSLDWAAGHIPGARHLYIYNDFTEVALSAVLAKDEEVVLYGQGAQASSYAARAAARAVAWGFTKVYYFRDGFPGWKSAGNAFTLAQD